MANREEIISTLKPNSHNAKELPDVPKKRVKTVTKARVNKKSLGKKFAEAFIQEDVTSVSDYIINDVLIPNIKNSLVDMLEGAIEMIFNGERRSPGNSNVYHANKPKTSYASYYKSETSGVKARTTGRYSVKDILVDTRQEADDIFSAMADAISEYGQASVGDLYDAVGITDSSFQDQNWGWTTMAGAGVKRVGDGYLLVLPKCESLK